MSVSVGEEDQVQCSQTSHAEDQHSPHVKITDMTLEILRDLRQFDAS